LRRGACPRWELEEGEGWWVVELMLVVVEDLWVAGQ
jgi:hypothetical protein